MLDAHDALHPSRDLLLDFSDDELNCWADSQMDASPIPSTPRASTSADERWDTHQRTDEQSHPSSNFSSPNGLRNRRNGSHRHTPTSSGSLPSHPLQAVSHSASNSVNLDDSITRPSLKRWLSSGGFEDEVRNNTSKRGESKHTPEILVIVHEVSRTDSMAGVALKYGISLVDLRKVNHLWASDTIHLRKVLYIPLHLTSRKYHYIDMDQAPPKISLEQNNSDNVHPSVVIRRVPVSELSFFPPPSQSIQSSRSLSGPYTAHFSSSISSSPRGPSFLQSLQLSSRDSFFPRISLDSSESSSTANVSEASSDQEHEMDVLNSSGKIRRRERTLSGRRNSTSYSDVAVTNRDTWDIEMSLNSKTPMIPTHVPLHTEQLRPSPAMEFPKALRGAGR